MHNITYISSRSNRYVQKYSKLSDKKQREKEGLFLIEGAKLFFEAVASDIELEAVLFLEGKENDITDAAYNKLKEKKRYSNVNLLRLSENAFSKISTEKSPDGVICVAKHLDNLKFYNKIEKNDAKKYVGEKIMLFCSVRDPGNIGTIIRSAVAFGFDRLIFSGDCADVYNSRTIRASMGALFKINIDFVDEFSFVISELVSLERRVFSAELRADSKSLDDVCITRDDCFVIGNEGHGIPLDISEKCSGSIYIPISPDSESLNAAIAASILSFVQR